MKKKKMRIAVIAICFCLIINAIPAFAEETSAVYPLPYDFEEYWFTEASAFSGSFDAKAALLMEAGTGTVIYSSNENGKLPIASVTKIMCTLLITEAIDSGKIALTDTVTVSERAASMGGSQIFLEPNEQMTVNDLLKSLIVVSANDASVALAEYVYGSEESFIDAMNRRAAELGMNNTHFANTTGLDDPDHYSTAYDIAVMTRELLKHELIFDYTMIWMDTVRNGAFGLSNTNRLIRFYPGANGMKTGFTDKAMYCLSGTAKRDGMQLIAVVLGAKTSDERFKAVKSMLDYGFANYSVFIPEKLRIEPVYVSGGGKQYIEAEYKAPVILTDKGTQGRIVQTVEIDGNITAPVRAGDTVGKVNYTLDGRIISVTYVYAKEESARITFWQIFTKILGNIFALC
ncbi:MAG: D-alanyl-D-alanine carboxypeptidase [Clostridia bacterium]|nr:D-alanyl-D-alanine carboxypeptidase [Clostridia bacterium]